MALGYIQLMIAAAVLAAGFASGWKLRDLAADAEAAQLRQAHATQTAEWERAARESTDQQRDLEKLRRKAVDKEVADVRQNAALDASRAADLRTANGRLLEHVARLAAHADQGCRDTAPAPRSAPATGPGLVLADLYRSVDREAEQLAASYDAARRAGLACERVYESLTPTPNH